MALIHLPQAKWGGGTGRQVILKSDFDKIEQAMMECFELGQAPALEYVNAATVQVPATTDCKARLMLCGFPSPLHRGMWVDGDLTDGRYRENASFATLDLAVTGSLWGSEKPSQWYCIYALAGSADTIFSLKAMPMMRVASQSTQIITLRNNPNTGNIGYGFATNELANGKILVLSGAARGLMRLITANNNDNQTGGTITYGGISLTLAAGDWFIVLPNTNFRSLGMVLNGSDGNLVPFFQEGHCWLYGTGRELASGAINGYTRFDLGLTAPPTARFLLGYAAALNGYDLKLAISYNGSQPALILHGGPPSGTFQGVRGALPFRCRINADHGIYLNNDNTANQVVNVLGWES
jgi:hypothetical protein